MGYPPRWGEAGDSDNDLTIPAYPASPYAPHAPGTPYPPATWHGAPPPPPAPQRPRQRRRHPLRRLGTVLAIVAAFLAVIAPKHHTATGQTTTTARHATATPMPTFAAPLLANTVAITDDSAPTLGNLDIFGDSYSAQALRVVHLAPGATFVYDGITFTWPAAAPGSANAMLVQGQQIAVQATGVFTTLAVLGASHYGDAQAPLTLHYAGGAIQHASLGLTDWTQSLGYGTVQYGNGVVAAMGYHNNGQGKVQQEVYVYYAAIHLLPGKILVRIDFPTLTSLAQMQIFAITAK